MSSGRSSVTIDSIVCSVILTQITLTKLQIFIISTGEWLRYAVILEIEQSIS